MGVWSTALPGMMPLTSPLTGAVAQAFGGRSGVTLSTAWGQGQDRAPSSCQRRSWGVCSMTDTDLLDPATEAVIRSGVVAVLRAATADGFAAVADVLADAGITAIEVTLTSQGAVSAIAGLVRQLPSHVVVGAGTVLTADGAKACVDAGAAFLVSPVLVPDVAAVGTAAGVPTYPGALTPTEVFAASRGGAPVVKLFPASTVGPRYLKHLHGPLPEVRIMPTGGIDLADVAAWLGAGAVCVGLGGPLLGDAATGGSLAGLRDRARRTVDAVTFARS
jgi:2-dehydro-3-deoxyphosphogluconate aldolase/(4S)-4-hydroxy-2-oxoglutarate aldolase